MSKRQREERRRTRRRNLIYIAEDFLYRHYNSRIQLMKEIQDNDDAKANKSKKWVQTRKKIKEYKKENKKIKGKR